MNVFQLTHRCSSQARLLITAGLLMAGATQNAHAESVVTLNWLVDSAWQNGLKPSIAKFEAANPGIKVVTQGLPFEQVFAQTQARLSAKSASLDLVSVDAPLVAAYALQNFLAPLDTAFSKADIASFLPASINSGIYGGKLLAPPLANSTQILYYNKDLLKKAGVPFPSDIPSKRLTWEQMADAARKAMVKQNNRVTAWGLTIEQVDRPYQLLPLPLSLGGQAIGKDGLSAQGIVNSPAWVKAFTFYQNLFNTWGITPKSASAAASDLFASGQSVFFWGGPWNLATFKARKGLNWGYTPTPYFAGGKPITPNDSWHIGVSRSSTHFDAAAKFVKFMTMGGGQDLYNAPANGGVPVLKRTAADIARGALYNKFPNSLQRLSSFEVSHTAVPRPLTPGFTEYQDILTSAFSDIRTGTDPKQALDAAAVQIDRALTKYRK